MKYFISSLLILQCSLSYIYSQPKATINQAVLSITIKEQATKMGNAFMTGDYKTFAKYTYPTIVTMMGGEAKMSQMLTNTISDMKSKGMVFSSVTFGEVSRIVKHGNELQCTLPQHIEIKLPGGRIVNTSTLIAMSPNNGNTWTFIDTSKKDMATIRKALPNLSREIIIPINPEAPKGLLLLCNKQG